jgi:cyclopropane-fatty-acyl-phospholipid synthase
MAPKRVAIVGGGVTGLAAAWHLHVNDDGCEVHLFEAAPRLGGHAYTTTVDGTPVDIGFMVMNEDNYPNLTPWFQEGLGVELQESDMSLSVSLDGGKTVEWSSDGLSGLLAKPSQAASPSFYRFLSDMMRFNAQAPKLLLLEEDDPRKHVTTAAYLRQHGYSESFCHYYLLPMMAALWSASMAEVLEFPAAQLVGFLCNHKMLQLFDRPQWKTVKGRSQVYTQRVREILGEARVHLGAPVEAVSKTSKGQYKIQLASTAASRSSSTKAAVAGAFDHVIFACAPPTARQILATGAATRDDALLQLLGAIQYADNVVYLHSDTKLMPVRRAAWASWNCLGASRYMPTHTRTDATAQSFEGGESGFGNTLSEKEKDESNGGSGSSTGHEHLEGSQGRMKAVYITYWLNRLQSLETETNIFVSLNPHQRPDPALTHQRVILAHPQFTPATLQARKTLEESYQGQDNLWFCGAWQGYGFHEDGCRAGFQVATKISGTPLPWASKATPVLPPPDLSLVSTQSSWWPSRMSRAAYQWISYDVPVALCRRFVMGFLKAAVVHGRVILQMPNGQRLSFGDGTPCGSDASPVVLRIFDEWFFVKVAVEYDLGLARSYMAGHFVVQPLEDATAYHPVIRPVEAADESTTVLGDPIGLTRLFLLLIGNRDRPSVYAPRKAAAGRWYNNALTNASGLVLAKVGSLWNYLRYRLTMDNSERGGSLKNIHAHYDLSNDLFRTFLDKETLMYSSAIYDAVVAPRPQKGLVFRGSLEEAQWRKLDTLLERAQVQPGQTLLDIGFGWGGLSLHAAKKYGCHVTGITLSVEQKALAEERVQKAGLQDLITFEVIDYRTFARQPRNRGKFDRVLSCEMIEAVGHDHLGEFFWAVEQVLSPSGILVMEAITTPEQRYETYLRSTDFINTIIFPGSCCPSLHALVDAAYKQSCLTLEHIDNVGLHYAQTLAEWRRRFNANEAVVRQMGFDDVFLRAWNYYLTYCEAGFFSQTENCLILVFSRQGCSSLVPLCETRSVTQALPFSAYHVQNWTTEAK